MPRSGVTYTRELEWRLAARWAGYRYEDFVKLSGERQSAHVAAYRTELQIEAVLAAAQTRKAKSKGRRDKNR